MADKIKIVLALLLFAAGIAGFYLLSEQALVLRVLAIAAGVIAGGVLFCKATEAGGRFVQLWREAWVELKKVVWPTRKETTQVTLQVFFFVVIMALFLFVADKSLEWLVYGLILGTPT
ncbi:MAG: preprotein translocase subunit SecE [Zoogloeaceae bacterium]|jgi:preprotein translocase subunit SecE|nr:preprotein translocase subunit SecE [Zoogloeaceae bacterium]